MEPLIALALAGNVIQFVDFARKLIKEGRELYRSNSGALETNEALKMITSDLRALVGKFRQSFRWTSAETANHFDSLICQDDVSLETICVRVADIAEELIAKLDRLGNGDTNGRPWSTLYQVVKNAWSKEEVEALVRRLTGYKNLLGTHILFSLRESLKSHAFQVSESFKALDRQNQLIMSTLAASNKASADVLTTMAQIASRVEASNGDHHRQTRQMILAQLRHQSSNIGSEDMGLKNITAGIEMLNVSELEEQKLRRLVKESILRSLRYPTMSHRYEGVFDAYPKTFEWAFQPCPTQQTSWTSLSRWLKAGEGVYWISGKAGSGKSTLMKHLFDDCRTRDMLTEWAQKSPPQPAPLCLATFFFWNSGSTEQKSQAGMLRSILSQVFEKHPELIPIILPLKWAETYSRLLELDSDRVNVQDIWSPRQLMMAFTDVLRQKKIPLKICFFIDGFDEFEGDQEEFAQILKDFAMAQRSGIKFCLSSRAWPVFRRCFDGCPTLRLQDLTFTDIETYVRDKMHGSNAFRELALKNSDSASQLIRATVERAEGVFLWVAIVVRSLLKGINNYDTISDLWRRLLALPRELEPLYKLLMSQIDSEYLEWASKAFQIVRICREMNNNPYGTSAVDSCMTPLTLSPFYAAMNDEILFESFQNWDTFSADISWRQAEIQLAARCAGLLELATPIGQAQPTSRVQYLHRTARDFLEMEPRWKAILAHTSEITFNPYSSMMKACAITLKLEYRRLSPAHDYLNEIYCVENAAFDFLVCAYNADSHQSTVESRTKLIESLNEMTLGGSYRNYHWMNLWLQYLPTPDIRSSEFMFLSFTAVFGLASYVRGSLCKMAVKTSQDTSTDLLRYLRLPRTELPPQGKMMPPFNKEIESLLLEFQCRLD